MARAARPCTVPGCPSLQPCTTHPPRRRWDGSTRNERRTGSGWDEQRRHRRIMRRDHSRCYLCGNPATQVDHVVPLFKGGSDRDDNLAAICTPCHDDKTKREAADARWNP